MFQITDDLRIDSLRPLIPPAILIEELPLSEHVSNVVSQSRDQVNKIVKGQDSRLLVIVGPCSIHDPVAALEYAEKLEVYAKRLCDELLVVMRVYFEKPRTTIGWKGLINDPNLDGSFQINKGLRIARKLLIDIGELGLPAGHEYLDPISPQFISDLISWGAIGARTSESQTHREMASGLSVAVGFKNATDGNIKIAIDAIGAARYPHHFLAVTKQGLTAIASTKGNDCCHLILRGSFNGPNYDSKQVKEAADTLKDAGFDPRLMIDCSHGNSMKDFQKQKAVCKDICEQLENGSQHICGVMIESNLVEGHQKLESAHGLRYGQSITDACVSWEDTVPMLEALAQSVKERNKK
ncbi:MAG: 3-deoxy-7-phosphoheptulonate synthase [Chlamydiota bacterium]|nr:3-deoxy-7-phosphoheptulonate synthase [Chlamydiota bacterium]